MKLTLEALDGIAPHETLPTTPLDWAAAQTIGWIALTAVILHFAVRLSAKYRENRTDKRKGTVAMIVTASGLLVAVVLLFNSITSAVNDRDARVEIRRAAEKKSISAYQNDVVQWLNDDYGIHVNHDQAGYLVYGTTLVVDRDGDDIEIRLVPRADGRLVPTMTSEVITPLETR